MAAMDSERARFWRQHLEQADRSGLTLADYADRHELSRQSLYQWRSTFRKHAPGPVDEQRLTFAEIVSTSQPRGQKLVVRLPNASLEFAELPDARWLGTLLDAQRR